MREMIEKLRILIPLALLGYLGFYAYGLLMGANSVTEPLALTLIAVAVLLALLGIVLYNRARPEYMEPTSRYARSMREQRERRGF